MAGGTGTFRTVGVDPADTGIGPGCRVEGAVAENLDFGPMTLPASVDRGRRHTPRKALGHHAAVSLDDLGEVIVERPEDPCGLRVARSGELGHLALMAPGAVAR